MLWLLLWIPLCSWFLLPRLGLLPTLALLDRLVPSFDLLQRNAIALWRNSPIAEALDRPARLSAYDRYTLFFVITLLYWLALLVFWRGTDFVSELILCSFALPPMQQQLAEWTQPLLERRDRQMRRIAAKCVVRAVRALSWALLHRPALVHSADVLPHIDRAPQLTWQVLKQGAMTAMLLYIKRYSQRSYYTAYKYFYYYQTEQLGWKQRPSAREARQQLTKMLDEQRWSEFATARAFGLAVILYHQGEPEVPQWVAQLNFSAARFFAVLTLSQAMQSWQPQLAPLGSLFALVLVQRSELSEYWRVLAAALLGAGAALLGAPLWLCAVLATGRPLWLTRALAKPVWKRLRYALHCRAPAVWLLCAALPLPTGAWQLLLYSLLLGWESALGTALLLLCGALSSYDPLHVLLCAAVASALYVLVVYSSRPETPKRPKTTLVRGHRVIEDYTR